MLCRLGRLVKEDVDLYGRRDREGLVRRSCRLATRCDRKVSKIKGSRRSAHRHRDGADINLVDDRTEGFRATGDLHRDARHAKAVLTMQTNKSDRTVARKLAVVLHRMWVDGTDFRWSAKEVAA